MSWPAPSSSTGLLNPELLTRERKIGEGGFGEVWLGAYNDSQCVIKSLRPRLQTRPEFVRRFAEEISLMSKLSHPNVVIYYGATAPPHQSLVLEFCEHGNLHDFLTPSATHGVTITTALILRFAIDIARGVLYLHSRCHLIQRDLKARNVLLDRSLNAKVRADAAVLGKRSIASHSDDHSPSPPLPEGGGFWPLARCPGLLWPHGEVKCVTRATELIRVLWRVTRRDFYLHHSVAPSQ